MGHSPMSRVEHPPSKTPFRAVLNAPEVAGDFRSFRKTLSVCAGQVSGYKSDSTMVFSSMKIKKKPEKIVGKPLAAGGRALSPMNKWLSRHRLNQMILWAGSDIVLGRQPCGETKGSGRPFGSLETATGSKRKGNTHGS
jgi:hypothetical protein